MDCERLTPPSGIPRSVYYARNKCICRKAEGRLTYYMLGIIGAALLPGREQQKYVIQESGCHLDAAHRACFSWTFSIYIKMLSTTNNVYLVSGIPGRGIVLFCWNEHTTYHVEHTHVCRRTFDFIFKSSLSCLALFQSACTMDIDTETWTVYRVCHPIMATRKWQAQYMHAPSYYCSWQRLSMDTVDKALSLTISIDLNYHKYIVAGNIYRYIPSTIHCNGQYMDSMQSIVARDGHR